jgi:hypothetical protein
MGSGLMVFRADESTAPRSKASGEDGDMLEVVPSMSNRRRGDGIGICQLLFVS